MTCVACMECGVASTPASTPTWCSMLSLVSVRCRPFCLAKASTSGVIVRVVPATKRITSLFSADSTSVLPHQPRPTIPALIMLYAPKLLPHSALVVRATGCYALIIVAAHPRMRPSLFGPSLFRPSQDGERDAGQRPECAIFDAADHP